MNLFTKLSTLLETRRRPIVKTIIGSIAVIGGSIGVIAITSNATPDKKPNNNDNLVVEEVTEGDTKTVIFDELEFEQATDETTVTTVKVTTSTAKTCTTTTVINTTASKTEETTMRAQKPQPAPAAVTPAVDDDAVATTVTETDTTVTTTNPVATTIESTTASESTTTTAEVVEPENNEYIVYKPSTHYVHRSTCHWYTEECYAITTTEGLECRICTECNPDITVVTPYVESPTANTVNTSGHAALNYVTEEERIYLCNTVAQEYGSDWVSIYDKASVVATVMNRVNDGGWTNGLPSTVYNVLCAPYQYNPAYAVPYYRYNVTQSCIDAVDYYFEHMSDFPNWHSFYGDGTYNYFR